MTINNFEKEAKDGYIALSHIAYLLGWKKNPLTPEEQKCLEITNKFFENMKETKNG